MMRICSWAALVLIGCTFTPEAPPPAPPVEVRPTSVILISLDTVRADRLAVYGGRAKTPNLQAFAEGGTRFERAIANITETALSHWGMLTGALPEVHGNVPATGNSRFTGPTLAERLKASGYATAAFIGGETLTDKSTGLSRGFDLYDDAYEWDRSDLKRPGTEVAARATGWIAEQTGPYFAFVHFFDAHFPYTPAAPWDTQYDPTYAGELSGEDADLRPFRNGKKTPTPDEVAHILALYDGELSELDQIIGPLLNAVGSDTLVIVTADHGESFEHGYYFNHRDGLWDSVLRVPLLMRGPGVAKGHVAKKQVELVDIAPTVLELLGMDPLEMVNGKGRAAEAGGAAVRTKPGHAITDPWRAPPQVVVTDIKRKVIATKTEGRRFDLLKDPGELKPRKLPRGTIDMVWAGYRLRLRDVNLRWQGPERPKRTMPPDQQQRLNALGYVDSPPAASSLPAPE